MLAFAPLADACTTFIVSGRYTPDGRPLLFKLRDTENLSNSLAYFTDGTYPYVGIVNSDKTATKMVWGGYNAAGFAIMNSAAYNNNIGDTSKEKDLEGVVMKKALMECRTVNDFEQLLKRLPKPLGVDANFGVIDAEGNGAYFETGNYSYRKVDVNDPMVAPHGYLLRTNFSYGGPLKEGYGFIRYNTANEALAEMAAEGSFTPSRIFSDIARSLSHSLTKTNLWKDMPVSGQRTDYRFFTDYIARHSTSSALLVVGLKKGENPQRIMMWTILGFPFTTVAIPTWAAGGNHYPNFMKPEEKEKSSICEAGLLMKASCYPYKMRESASYINLAAVINKENSGYLQQILPIEQKLIERAFRVNAAPDSDFKQEVEACYEWISKFVPEEYQLRLGINLKNLK